MLLCVFAGKLVHLILRNRYEIAFRYPHHQVLVGVTEDQPGVHLLARGIRHFHFAEDRILTEHYSTQKQARS